MTTPHRGTPELWEFVTELRDRIAALEDAANSSAGLTGSNHPAKPDSSPAPADDLLQTVAHVIHSAPSGYGYENEAYAAIKAVANWFDSIGYGATASILRQELQRHA